MSRSPRSRASIGTTTTTTPKKDTADTDFKTPRATHNARRHHKYKQAKRAQKFTAVKTAIKTADNPVARKEALALRGELYRTWKPRSEKKLAELERVVKAQQAEIEELRRLAQGGAAVVPPPKLEAVGTPRRVKREARREGDSSPLKIEQQLMEDLAAPSNAVVAQEPGTVVKVEKVVEESAEPMDGVEKEMTVAISVEKEVDEPTLASGVAEGLKVEEAPTEVKKQEIRESSADTNAGTPRNVRRSPRKRTVKRRSLGGR